MRGIPCMIHHGNDWDVFRIVEKEMEKTGFIVYGEIVDKCYGSLCATYGEVTSSVDALILSNILTETYDSINLDLKDKKYVYMYTEISDKNWNRI